MLQIDEQQIDDTVVLVATGEIDMYSSPSLREKIVSHTDKKAPAVILDLSKVSYTDSSGLATMIEGLQATGKYGGRFLITGINENVRDVFQLSQLDKVFEIYDDVEQALQQLKKQ
jgi:anti-sigma B factor antagonist